jgi:putative (di)nucleoside polyphosphate hydrolase
MQSVDGTGTRRPDRTFKRSEICAAAGRARSVKTTSCGIVICHASGELLMCHATGAAHWDIPKGSGEAGESPMQTAIRETAEECALVFDPGDLLELGRFHYRPAKDLHLYAALVERIDIRQCSCSTHFRDRFGRDRPEMDAFDWVPFVEVTSRCAKSLAALLSGALPLDELLARLRQHGRVAKPHWRNRSSPE